MKVYFKDEVGNVKEVSSRCGMFFCPNDEEHYHGIEVSINYYNPKLVYVSSSQVLKIFPNASNVILISHERM